MGMIDHAGEIELIVRQLSLEEDIELVRRLLSERDEVLNAISAFKRHKIPCIICDYKEGLLIEKCWLHQVR